MGERVIGSSTQNGKTVTVWLGKGKTMRNPAKFIAEKDFYFGGKLIPNGTQCRQFETRDFGWTSYTGSDGKIHLAKE
jgi:hypothetical protein